MIGIMNESVSYHILMKDVMTFPQHQLKYVWTFHVNLMNQLLLSAVWV